VALGEQPFSVAEQLLLLLVLLLLLLLLLYAWQQD
jgi:hypothetical protein